LEFLFSWADYEFFWGGQSFHVAILISTMLRMWTKQFSRRLLAVALVGSFSLGTLAFAGQSSDDKQQQQDRPRRGRKYTPPKPTSHVEITVLRASSGKPIPNAGVVFHVEGDKGNMELKSDGDGKAVIDILPTGSTILLQVIAKGFQTYGESFKLDTAQKAIEVHLQKPQEQYSIYKNHDQNSSNSQPGSENAQPQSGGEKKSAENPQ
jgi:hypothetical protein